MNALMIALEVDSGRVRLTCAPCADPADPGALVRWTVWTAPISRPGAVAEIVRRAARHGEEQHGIHAEWAQNIAASFEPRR